MGYAPLPAAPPEPQPDAPARASASVIVLGLDEFVQGLRALQPRPAYRLSLDSGIEYKNVRRALQQPGVVRLGTWRRLLRSLRVPMVAARREEDVIWPGSADPVLAFGPEASALVAPSGTTRLRELRGARGLSRRDLARRAAVSVDAIASLEAGGGTLGKLVQVCLALELRLLLALPPPHATLQSLWHEGASRCLLRPAQFQRARRRPPCS